MAQYCTTAQARIRLGLTTSDVSDSDLSALIDETTNEIDVLTGKSWQNGTAKTDYFSGKKKDIFGNVPDTFYLTKFPTQSITSFLRVDIDGNTITTYGTLSSANISAGTYETDDYWLTPEIGKIQFKTDIQVEGSRNYKIAYTYGTASVPIEVRQLCEVMSGIKAWVEFLGGKYNYANNYEIPEQSVSKGDLYARGLQQIHEFEKERDRLLNSPTIGQKLKTFFVMGDTSVSGN